MENLKETFESACEEYLSIFSIKHPSLKCKWKDGYEGGMVSVGEGDIVPFSVIRYDIDAVRPPRDFIAWLEKSKEITELQDDYDAIIGRDELALVGYDEFCEGKSFPYTPEQIRDMKQASADVWYAKARYKDEVKKYAREK